MVYKPGPINHKRHYSPSTITWDKAAHEADLRAAKGNAWARRRDSEWAENVVPRTRIVDTVARDCGENNREVTLQVTPAAIRWDAKLGRYVANTTERVTPTLRQQAHLVKQGARR